MKKTIKLIALLTLALALLMTQAAWAEPDAAVQGIYDALVKEGTDYSANKALYAEYYPDMKYEETLDDDGFTIAITGSEYMDGSWTFTREGDYLVTSFSSEDFGGLSQVLSVIDAVADYLGMNSSLTHGYVNAMTGRGIENENFIMGEDGDNTTVRIYIAGPWDMTALDEMPLDDSTLMFDALDENFTSQAGSAGKLMVVANGSKDDLTILLGEYGALDDLARQSIVNVVNLLKPDGWEDFVANYTELSDAEADGYTVTLNVDTAAVGEIIDDANPDYSYAVIRFGA